MPNPQLFPAALALALAALLFRPFPVAAETGAGATRVGTLLVAPVAAGATGAARDMTKADTLSAASADAAGDPAPRRRLLDVAGLEKERKAAAAGSKDGNLRVRVLSEAAGTLAFQQGLRWRYARLADACRQRASVLDRMFDFRPLLLEGRVLPPVIRWAGRSVTLHDNGSATAVDATYRIVEPARLVSAPPVWQAYLLADFEAFDANPALLPATSAEKAAWKAGVEKGWAEGVAHADEVFAMNMAKLVGDYRGMLRFRMLAQAGMVSVPVLARGRLGVRVGERTLDVNQTLLRISVPARFLEAERWAPGSTGRPQ